MPSDALNSEIDALRARLQAELETQLTTIQTKLEERHQAELAEARRVTAAEAREHWSARLDALRAEWASQLRAEVAGASAESARAHAAEIARLQAEKSFAISATEAGAHGLLTPTRRGRRFTGSPERSAPSARHRRSQPRWMPLRTARRPRPRTPRCSWCRTWRTSAVPRTGWQPRQRGSNDGGR